MQGGNETRARLGSCCALGLIGKVAAEPGRCRCLQPACQPARGLAPAQPGCRSSLPGSSPCPGAAAALLSGLIHILDVQAFGERPPAQGVTAHGRVPGVQGASPASCWRAGRWWQLSLRSALLCGARRSPGMISGCGQGGEPQSTSPDGDTWVAGRMAACPGVDVPAGSAGAPVGRGGRGKQLPGKPRARVHPLTAGCQKGSGAAVGREGGEPGGTQLEQGSCAGLKGTASPEWSCAGRHGARVPHHRQAELAPSRASPRLCPSRAPAHVWEQGGPREATIRPGTLDPPQPTPAALTVLLSRGQDGAAWPEGGLSPTESGETGAEVRTAVLAPGLRSRHLNCLIKCEIAFMLCYLC